MNLKEPGHLNVGLVHQCTESSIGQYDRTLQRIDVATVWSEPVAVLSRSYLVMKRVLVFFYLSIISGKQHYRVAGGGAAALF